MRSWRQARRAAGRADRRPRTAALALALTLATAAKSGPGEVREGGGIPAGATPPPVTVAPSVRRVLELEGDPESGARVYRTCAVCHLADGSGRPDGTFPQLAGQHREVIVKQLVDIREGRRHNPVMEPWAEDLVDDRDVANVAAYIDALPVPRTPSQDVEAASEPDGAELYRRDCRSCHGAHGEGDAARFVPVLAGRHEPYLLRQIRAIAAGRRGNAHPAMERVVERYTDAELRAVVRHAIALPGPNRGS